jgi:hypothetical protein
VKHGRSRVTDRARASVEPHVGQFNWQLPREPISELGRKAPRRERSETFAEKRTGPINASGRRAAPGAFRTGIWSHLLLPYPIAAPRLPVPTTCTSGLRSGSSGLQGPEGPLARLRIAGPRPGVAAPAGHRWPPLPHSRMAPTRPTEPQDKLFSLEATWTGSRESALYDLRRRGLLIFLWRPTISSGFRG